MNKIRLDEKKLAKLNTANNMLADKYGAKGTQTRKEFDAKADAWYFAEIIKERRKQKRWTQARLAEEVGKKREYIGLLEKGKTDMQLSTFLAISNALGLNVLVKKIN